jgi:hypothetical protein
MGGLAGGGDLAVPSPGPPPLRMVPGLMLIAPHRLTHGVARQTGNVSVESSVCERRCVGEDVSSHHPCLSGDQFVIGMSVQLVDFRCLRLRTRAMRSKDVG